MPTEQDMIDRINAEQGEGIRLAEHVYISWLEDLGDPRAEAWRVLIEAGKRPWFDEDYIDHDPWTWRASLYRGEPAFLMFSPLLPNCEPGGLRYHRTFFDAMNAAAVAWVRCHRDPEFAMKKDRIDEMISTTAFIHGGPAPR